MCGTAMPQVNSDANTPPGTPAWCNSSQTITASPAARCNSRGSSPLRSHSSTCGKISRSAKERTVFRSCSRPGVVQMLTTTLLSQQHCRNVDMAAAYPFTQPFGLRIEARLIGDALPEDLLDDEVHRAQVGQQVPGDRQVGGFGKQLLEQLDGEGVGQPAPLLVAADPHPDIGRPALVAAASGGDAAKRCPLGLAGRQRLRQRWRIGGLQLESVGS